jgi:hypothetical protein
MRSSTPAKMRVVTLSLSLGPQATGEPQQGPQQESSDAIHNGKRGHPRGDVSKL